MVRITLIGVALVCIFQVSQAQESSIEAPKASQHVKVYQAGPQVTAPELLPATPMTLPPVKCNEKLAAKPVLAFVVDSDGLPRNIQFLRPAGTVMDEFALRFLFSDRFKAGTSNGIPVAVWRSVEVELEGCNSNEGASKGMQKAYLRSLPIQKFNALPHAPTEATLAPVVEPGKTLNVTPKDRLLGSGIVLPVLFDLADVEFSEEDRRANEGGTCTLSLVVDAYGMPRNIQVVRHLKPATDEKAVSVVSHYRFKPAMQQGEPIAVQISVEVNFRAD